ncbi:MAG: hypothetical protein MIO93_13450 [ANME-2 cluster archaeon]|jgi:hypothetical protein|nr:hypothetical protein [ANME-2 cluster archaeon]
MDGIQKFISMIVVAFGCLLLLVAGIVLMFYQENVPGEKYPGNTNVDTDDVTVNTWFNGSRYINTSDQWAYIELTFPSEYVGMGWEVSVYGVEYEEDNVFIYSMDSRVNSSVNGVKLNLDNNRIEQFDCFDIEVSVEDTSQTETVCLGELEVR